MGMLSQELVELSKGTLRKAYVDWDLGAIVAIPTDDHPEMIVTFGRDEMEAAFDFIRPMVEEYANGRSRRLYDAYIMSKSRHELPNGVSYGD